MESDYYAILGLQRGASAADIKRAYRRLARKHHPGINPGDRAAEALFQQISEAYETLVDADRRRHYDAAGSRTENVDRRVFEFSGFDFTVAAQGSQAATFTELFADILHPVPSTQIRRAESGPDLHTSLSLSFEDALRGVERQVVVMRQVECEGCRGAGERRTAEARCAPCQGVGQVRWARGHMVFTKACTACGGTGKERSRRCPLCAGQGRSVRSEAISVRVPPGVRDGARLRVSERGHAGGHGARNGHLYVDVTVRPHPKLRREGDDLYMAVPVAVYEAALGARIEVPSIDGSVRMTLPPGVQAGKRVRVQGRGAASPSGRRGDLWLEVQLTLPPLADERSRELMRELARLNTSDVRREFTESFKSEG
ncbi:molecular chaperone DnaJ [soil metagenome]